MTLADYFPWRINLTLIPQVGAWRNQEDDASDDEGLSDVDKDPKSVPVVGSKILELVALAESETTTSTQKSPPKREVSCVSETKGRKPQQPGAASSSKMTLVVQKSSPVHVLAPPQRRCVAKVSQKPEFLPGTGLLDFSDTTTEGTRKLFCNILHDRNQEWSMDLAVDKVFMLYIVHVPKYI